MSAPSGRRLSPVSRMTGALSGEFPSARQKRPRTSSSGPRTTPIPWRTSVLASTSSEVSSEVATITCPPRFPARFAAKTAIGSPWKSSNALPGNLWDPVRAWRIIKGAVKRLSFLSIKLAASLPLGHVLRPKDLRVTELKWRENSNLQLLESPQTESPYRDSMVVSARECNAD